MDGDRWTCLAVRAYAKGLLSFKSEEQSEERWQLREEILLAEVEREALAKLHEMLHTAESAMAQYVEQRIFDHHYKQAQKQYRHVAKLIYSYGTDSKDNDEQVLDSLTKEWLAAYQDPNSEEVKKAIEYLNSF